MKKNISIFLFGLSVIFVLSCYYMFLYSKPQDFEETPREVREEIREAGIEYVNPDYGFAFSLPENWNGYTVETAEWQGYASGNQRVEERGTELLIRHPRWTEEIPRQDIPIMIFTIGQWNRLLADEFHIGAAPVNPAELGRNNKYVFALPARYNYAFPEGYEEVENILKENPLNAFDI